MSGAIVDHIISQRTAITDAVIKRHWSQDPELAARYDERARKKCAEDVERHISYLCESIASAQSDLFAEYIAWANVVLMKYNIPTSELKTNLDCLLAAVVDACPDAKHAVSLIIGDAVKRLDAGSPLPESFIAPDKPHAALAKRYLDCLLKGDRHEASKMILAAAGAEVPVRDIYLHVFQPAQREIGLLWQKNEVSVAQEHYCTAATQMIMSQLYPRIFSKDHNGKTMVATCVNGDLHEIGVRMVADFMEMNGWDTHYLGANSPSASITQTLKEKSAVLLAVSATMTFHLHHVSALIKAVRSDPALKNVKILVGGYPFSVARNLWEQMGADGFAADAESAASVADTLTA